mmetsp:Transcript_3680/g.8739  ORF Transcript_3680/g.8739 Transcript_3680/m.8739 type:complete len:927 (+) Transcript_3680:110-2890(+)
MLLHHIQRQRRLPRRLRLLSRSFSSSSSRNPFEAACLTELGDKTFYSLKGLGADQKVRRLPYCIRVLLESAVRNCDGEAVLEADVDAILNWSETATKAEVPFKPSRVIMQDMSGGPCLMDLAAMRAGVHQLGKDPLSVNPLVPVDLVIDHSVIADSAGNPNALKINMEKEFTRNHERFALFKWASGAFQNMTVVPPGTGIIHQVNLEYLARCVFENPSPSNLIFPDSMVGTDSHSTMVNGLGVVGWGVGGIEALSVILGQAVVMPLPEVLGVRLKGTLAEGVMATDLVLQVVQVLRQEGVVGKFVEFFGEGVQSLSLADRATVANMAPEYGATMGYFPPDEVTLAYYEQTGRGSDKVALARQYGRENLLLANTDTDDVEYSRVIEVDLGSVQPCVSGPKRPHDRVALTELKSDFESCMDSKESNFKGFGRGSGWREEAKKERGERLTHGDVVVASITSCTNTSNPSVMIGAGLLAKKAVEMGLSVSPHIKTSLSPGSRVVGDYLEKTGLQEYLDKLGFHVTGYGCMTCVGNSGELQPQAMETVAGGDVASSPVLAGVLSGNRNFEARVHPLVAANYLASPPLVVAFALAGRVDIDLASEPIGHSTVTGEDVYLKDLWPSPLEIEEAQMGAVEPSRVQELYEAALMGDERWKALKAPTGGIYEYDPSSTYICPPPFLEGVELEVKETLGNHKVEGIRCLLKFGDSITTDHISPVSRIPAESHSGRYLSSLGVESKDYGSYGTRRGNAEVMVRGTFANLKLDNHLVPEVGPKTIHHPTGAMDDIQTVSARYAEEKVPLLVIAGSEYGQGSARDWAAKGTALLGIRYVLAKSFERIHRSNLVGMGVVPLQFVNGEDAETLGLDGTETFSVTIPEGCAPGCEDVRVCVQPNNNEKEPFEFRVKLRLDTEPEKKFFQHGGVMPYVMRQLAQ